MNFIEQYKASVTSFFGGLSPENNFGGAPVYIPDSFSPKPYLRLICCFGQSFPRGSVVSHSPMAALRLVYVRQGLVSLSQAGLEIAAGSECVLAIPCSVEYSLSSTDGAECLEWFLDGPAAQYYMSLLEKPEYRMTPICARSDFGRLADDFFGNIQPLLNDPLRQTEALIGLLHSLIRESRLFARHAADAEIPSYLSDIHDQLMNDYRRPCSLDELEERYKISKFRISREFSAAYGTSIIACLNNRRLEAAAALLLSTDYRVNVIGVMVGFDNTDHFIRLFKRRYLQTPGAYRTSHTP